MKEILLPSLGEGVASGVVVSILVKTGENINVEQGVIEVETDKVTTEVPSEYSGVVTEILVNEGDDISEGEVILRMETEDVEDIEIMAISKAETIQDQPSQSKNKNNAEVKSSSISATYDTPSNPHTSSSMARTTPRARKLARELRINLDEVHTTNGLIIADNVKSHVRSISSYGSSQHFQSQHESEASRPKIQLPSFNKWGDVNEQPMSGMMKATAKNMQTSWNNIPHAWLQEEANITKLDSERKQLNEKNGLKLSMTVFIIKAVTQCLKEFPLFNTSLDLERNQVIYKNYYNVGVAVDTEHGLYVPVIKNVEGMGLYGIGAELVRLSSSAKDKKLNASDLEGGNFTISNLGVMGTTAIFPIILSPQVGILGVAGYQMRHEQKFLPLTVGFDHRIINGADAVRFINHLKTILEEPYLMIMS